MKFALVEGQRQEAQRDLLGKCPICENPVVAKCGNIRIWHWAHRGKHSCDPWWENETEWHRTWKGKFPSEWQEFPQHDLQTGEKHIADVRTKHGLVIEFQHSHLDPEERLKRERFYGNMVWVVDGTRLKRDYLRFQKGFGGFIRTNKQDFFFVPNPEKCIPITWLNSPVSVFFDFLGVVSADSPDQMRNILWQLLPGRKEEKALVVAVSRTRFVETFLKGPPAPPAPPQFMRLPPIRRHFRL